jgi:hypothetical protein
MGKRPCLIAECGMDAPCQQRRIERRFGLHGRDQLADLLPQPPGEVFEANVRADAMPPRQIDRQPPPDGGARHDDLVFRED